MAGKLNHRHVSSLPDLGGDISSPEWNDSLIASQGSDGQVMSRDAASPDGWKWVTVSSYTPPSDTLSAARSATVATYNLSTLGTVDWFFPNGQTSRMQQLGNGVVRHKALGGGYLYAGFEWIMVGGPTVFSQAIGSAITTTTGDDTASAGAAGVTGGQGVFTNAGAGYGFRLSVPAVSAARSLVIFASTFSCDAILTARLVGQSTQSTTVTTLGVVSTAREDIFTVNYSAALGGFLTVQYVLSNVLGVNQGPNVKFGFAYVS